MTAVAAPSLHETALHHNASPVTWPRPCSDLATQFGAEATAAGVGHHRCLAADAALLPLVAGSANLPVGDRPWI